MEITNDAVITEAETPTDTAVDESDADSDERWHASWRSWDAPASIL